MKNQILLLVLALVLSCKKDSESIGPCGTTKPLEDLDWLKKRVSTISRDTTDQSAIFSGFYRKQRVFWVFNSSRGYTFEYFDCEGTMQYIMLPLQDDDLETRAFLKIYGDIKSCTYEIWENSAFKKYSTCL
jgi:hypothetical protein